MKIEFKESVMQVLIPCSFPNEKNMVEGIENVIVSLYAKGMSVSDIEE